jgi:hypothetical protein
MTRDYLRCATAEEPLNMIVLDLVGFASRDREGAVSDLTRGSARLARVFDA